MNILKIKWTNKTLRRQQIAPIFTNVLDGDIGP